MKKYFYLVASPETLIASHLNPFEFGNYMAVGTKKNLRSQSIFFELDPEKLELPEKYINEKLVPYPDGEPKRSVYLSIYRVLEKTPIDALKNLYLVTDDGKVLEIKSKEFKQNKNKKIHLYQQFNPFKTMVASKLNPVKFILFLTNQSKPVSVPKLFFAELILNELANDPNLPIKNLPYRNPVHLRECLIRLHHPRNDLPKQYFEKGRQNYRIGRLMKDFLLEMLIIFCFILSLVIMSWNQPISPGGDQHSFSIFKRMILLNYAPTNSAVCQKTGYRWRMSS